MTMARGRDDGRRVVITAIDRAKIKQARSIAKLLVKGRGRRRLSLVPGNRVLVVLLLLLLLLLFQLAVLICQVGDGSCRFVGSS
jgi:hypothetical protein